MRELIFQLQEIIENHTNNFVWGFKTEKTPEARITCIYIVHEKKEWIKFRSQAKPAVKGDKKRDGPMWTLIGGKTKTKGKRKRKGKVRKNSKTKKKKITCCDGRCGLDSSRGKK